MTIIHKEGYCLNSTESQNACMVKIGLYILEVLVGIAMELCSRKGTRKSCFLFSMIEVLESGIHLLVLST